MILPHFLKTGTDAELHALHREAVLRGNLVDAETLDTELVLRAAMKAEQEGRSLARFYSRAAQRRFIAQHR